MKNFSLYWDFNKDSQETEILLLCKDEKDEHCQALAKSPGLPEHETLKAVKSLFRQLNDQMPLERTEKPVEEFSSDLATTLPDTPDKRTSEA